MTDSEPCMEVVEKGGDIYVCAFDADHDGDHEFYTTVNGNPGEDDTRIWLV